MSAVTTTTTTKPQAVAAWLHEHRHQILHVVWVITALTLFTEPYLIYHLVRYIIRTVRYHQARRAAALDNVSSAR
ncbi:MAG: hypothetical protein ACRD6B_15875 [Bryobacteraceae bacterium]